MIKFVDSSDFDLNGVCSDDVFGTRILAYYNTYGAEFDFFKLWVQLVNDEITAAVCLIDGSATLTCRDNADFDELSAFLRMVGFATLQADLGAAKKLAAYCRENGIEVIHAQYPRENIIALLSKLFYRRVKVVYTSHLTIYQDTK